ncbi:MAG: DUF3035 domain-containing protein [Rhodospirillaceae bacterium]|jgi:hypothetical protein
MKTSRLIGLVAGFAAMALLTGCDETKRALGQTKESPDEFAVYERAPLSVPPEYTLRPPAPGAQRPQAVNPRDRAAQALGVQQKQADRSNVGQNVDLRSLSSGERAVLNLTGADRADPTIRDTVNKETSVLFEDSKSFTDKIVFWQSNPEFGASVDPEKESKRIKEAQALGKPINSGAVPVIKRRKKALLEGILN